MCMNIFNIVNHTILTLQQHPNSGSCVLMGSMTYEFLEGLLGPICEMKCLVRKYIHTHSYARIGLWTTTSAIPKTIYGGRPKKLGLKSTCHLMAFP